MHINYNNNTKKYRCEDSKGNWYPQGDTMLAAIQNALSIICYYKSLN